MFPNKHLEYRAVNAQYSSGRRLGEEPLSARDKEELGARALVIADSRVSRPLSLNVT